MLEPANYIIDAAAWQRELLAIKRLILDAEPVAALARLDALRRELAESK